MKIENALRDQYRKLAKDQGYRSRSAYKLLEINNKHNVIEPNDTILDIGCAPGGWLQVANVTKTITEVSTLQLNIEDPDAIEKIRKNFPFSFDVVLSDLSPKVSGIWHFDHERQISLTLVALQISSKLLKRGGNAIFKIFDGSYSADVKQEAAKIFMKVTTSKPKASRQKSSEFYVICSEFKGKRE